MHAAFSSVNFGLKVKPSREKKSIDLFRSRTARLTKIFLARVATIGRSCVVPAVIVSVMEASSKMKIQRYRLPRRDKIIGRRIGAVNQRAETAFPRRETSSNP